MNDLNWVEISGEALKNNVRQFRGLIGGGVLLCACVKANAYGHGLVGCARAFLDGGADWLSVNAIFEARELRAAGINAPIYILGYVPLSDLEEAIKLDCRLVVYNKEIISELGKINKPVKIHIKIETGNNRQGVLKNDLIEFAQYIKTFKNIEIEGMSTHFANIEDTTDHSYADLQLARFNDAIKKLESIGINVPIKHCANSAATILFPKTHFQMVRVGIGLYGLWPSKETFTSYAKEIGDGFNIKPALTWETKIAQIKTIPAGEFIGYGCTYKTGHETKLAIIPVGYYDGYDRGISGTDAYVLIRGKRAPVRGRICMNIFMAEVTDIPDARIEDEVILIGKSGGEEISASQFGQWAGTINYEVTTRINERVPRISG